MLIACVNRWGCNCDGGVISSYPAGERVHEPHENV